MGGVAFQNKLARCRFRARLLSKYSRIALELLGINVHHLSQRGGSQTNKLDQNFLIVGNHLSYLDVLILSASFPSVFVTSVEVRETPILGTLCKLGGCLFVERRSRAGLLAEIGELRSALMGGLNVVVFPEATSSNGATVLPFKASMFQAAATADIEVLPICLKYFAANSRPIDESSRDSICYYGSMSFGPHFVRMLKLRSIDIQLTILPSPPKGDLKFLRNESYRTIAEYYLGEGKVHHFQSSGRV